jgi:hypothetical protein
MPDTINKHRAHLIAPYKHNDASEAKVCSAKRLAALILQSNELLPAHRLKMLKEVLWLVSEADGKHSTRYRSKEVVRLATNVPDCEVRIQHEHVYPKAVVARRLLAEREVLLASPGELDKVLDQTIGCIVTVDEHKKLPDGEGWARYAKAEVPVLDMSTVPPTPVDVSENGTRKPGRRIKGDVAN